MFGTMFVEHLLKVSEQMNQTTLQTSVEIRGVGLHTGVDVNMTIRPAPENTGYIFVRTDLDNFEIPASVEYISHCSYATTLMRRGVVLSTCEHLLSALRGSGVDNCFIEVDSIEIPIMDGSSEDFIELIAKAGIVEQHSPRHIFRILERVEYEQGDRKMSIEPAKNYEIDCVIDFPHPFIERQRLNFVFKNGSFGKQIASDLPMKSRCSARRTWPLAARSTTRSF
jgi:UDP-3-O-[3-hydroxymyristoyl] N-acetylglucosamine deacetylase